MKYYIGADLGTSSLKLLLTNEKSQIVNSVTKDYDVSYPKSGWSEQNPLDWWEALVNGVKELINDIDKNDVKGIGVAGQMHGLVVLDKDDNVIRPTILWNDGRTQKETDYLNNEIGKEKLSELLGDMPEKADAIVVFGGTNDFGHGQALLGTPDDRTPETFWGACHVLMQGLMEKYMGKPADCQIKCNTWKGTQQERASRGICEGDC